MMVLCNNGCSVTTSKLNYLSQKNMHTTVVGVVYNKFSKLFQWLVKNRCMIKVVTLLLMNILNISSGLNQMCEVRNMNMNFGF